MRNSRLIGGKPKIGIRPIIDGRRGGIRESLEDMTMAMAHKVAELYSSVLRHSDGTSVECVIADTTIGGVAEAAMAAEKFRNSGVGVMDSRLLIWTEKCQKPSGALMVQNVRVRFTWLQHWQAIHRRDCLLLAFTDVMYRR